MALSMRCSRFALNKVFGELSNPIVCQKEVFLRKLLPPLGSYSFLQQQQRGKRSVIVPNRSIKPKYHWEPRKTSKQDTNLTSENTDFVKNLVHESYADSPLRDTPWPRHEWTYQPATRRPGLIGIKMGTTQQWLKNGVRVNLVMIQILDNHVINYIPPEEFQDSMRCPKLHWKGKYGLTIVGALSCDPHVFHPQYNSMFEKAGTPPKRKLARFLTTSNAAIEPGTPLTAMHFRVGDYIDVSAKTIGRGFQGVMKRWGMKGGRATHGVTKSHRRMGATGGGGTLGKIFKGKKMPGRMGFASRTLRGVQILRMNTKYNILYLNASGMPGPNHCYVNLMDTMYKHRLSNLKDDPPPMPTWRQEDMPEEGLPEEVFHPSLYVMGEESLAASEIKKITL